MLMIYHVCPFANVVGRENHNEEVSIAAMSLASRDMEELRSEQLFDPHIEPVLRVKETTIKPTADEIKAMGLSSRRLFQLWEQLTIMNGLLSCQYETPDGSTVFLSSWSQHPGVRKSSMICTKVLLVGTWVNKKPWHG